MLEEVREPRPPRLLVLRADVVPLVDVHDRELAVDVQDDLQAVRQGVLLELDLGDLAGAPGDRRGGGSRRARTVKDARASAASPRAAARVGETADFWVGHTDLLVDEHSINVENGVRVAGFLVNGERAGALRPPSRRRASDRRTLIADHRSPGAVRRTLRGSRRWRSGPPSRTTTPTTVYDFARLEKQWSRLHAGDAEPWPQDDKVVAAWALFHAGEFRKAVDAGLKAGGAGVTAANKAQCIYAHYLEKNAETRLALYLEAAARAEAQQRAEPENPNAWYWHGYALGRYGQGISVVKALAQGLGGKVKAALERTIALAPGTPTRTSRSARSTPR